MNLNNIYVGLIARVISVGPLRGRLRD